MIPQNIASLLEDGLENLDREVLIDLCNTLVTENQHLSEIERIHQQKLVDYSLQQDHLTRCIGNKAISSSQVRIFIAVLNEVRRQGQFLRMTTEYIPIDIFRIEESAALSHKTVCREIARLESYGVWSREENFKDREKRGRKIIVKKIGLRLSKLAIEQPEDIRPGAGQERKHGGYGDRCRKCKSKRVKRIFHLVCLDCGFDDPHYPEEYLEEFELGHLDRVPDLADELGQDDRVPDLADELGQDDRVQLGDFFFNEEQFTFIERWRIVSKDPLFIPRTIQAYNDVVKLAAVHDTTDKLQDAFDKEYARLTEYAKAFGRIATPPRLYNLRKQLPDLLASQSQKEVQVAAPIERRYERWKAPPDLDYSLVLEMAAERDKRRKPGGNITWRAEDAADFLKRVRRKRDDLE